MAYKQARARRKKLLKTYNETKYGFGTGVAYNEERGFYYKYTPSSTPGYAKSLRKYSNKRVRRADDIGNFGSYRKQFDYKWTIF